LPLGLVSSEFKIIKIQFTYPFKIEPVTSTSTIWRGDWGRAKNWFFFGLGWGPIILFFGVKRI